MGWLGLCPKQNFLETGRQLESTGSEFKDILSQVLVAPACNPSYSGGRDQEDDGSRPAWKTLSWKYPTQNRPGGVAQVIERLPSKCEALTSNPSTTTKKKKKKKKII
jgi:hypothetical protein